MRILLICLLFSLSACSQMRNQTAEIIELNKRHIVEELQELQQQNVITTTENEQLKKRLVQDLDYYLQHQDMNTADIINLFNETSASFKNIKITYQIFVVISTTYNCITSQRMMKNYPPKMEMEIQVEVNKMMNAWFDKYQQPNDKLDDLIARVKNHKKEAANKEITALEYDAILQTLSRIKQDSTLNSTAVKNILLKDMAKYANRSNDTNLEIFNIYNTVNDIKKLGIEAELKSIYTNNFVKPVAPSFAEMSLQVSKRFKWMLEEEIVDPEDYTLFTKTILADIDFCEKSDNKTDIKTRLLKSLTTLSRGALETEDREAVVDWYYLLAQKKNVDIGKELNHWLYPFIKGN